MPDILDIDPGADPPADLIRVRVGESLDSCESEGESTEGMLVCHRPPGHDGPHYDRLDSVQWEHLA